MKKSLDWHTHVWHLLHFAGCFVQYLGLGSSKLNTLKLHWFSVQRVLGLNTVSEIFFSSYASFLYRKTMHISLISRIMFQVVLTFCHVSLRM